MNAIVTTSNRYLHLIPVFIYLFNKNWSDKQQVEIVGYDPPRCELPPNFTFHSMGEQGPVNEWSTDLRKYFEQQEEFFIWMMEDSFIRKAAIDDRKIELEGVGRFDLSGDLLKRRHMNDDPYAIADSDTRYRLSTQPSIWNKEFLLKYLTPGLTPWDFETQDPINDGWKIVGYRTPVVIHNEGVRKSDPWKLDLNGFSEEEVTEINKILEQQKALI